MDLMSELYENLQTVPLLDDLQRQGADIVAGRFTEFDLQSNELCHCLDTEFCRVCLDVYRPSYSL